MEYQQWLEGKRNEAQSSKLVWWRTDEVIKCFGARMKQEAFEEALERFNTMKLLEDEKPSLEATQVEKGIEKGREE